MSPGCPCHDRRDASGITHTFSAFAFIARSTLAKMVTRLTTLRTPPGWRAWEPGEEHARCRLGLSFNEAADDEHSDHGMVTLCPRVSAEPSSPSHN